MYRLGFRDLDPQIPRRLFRPRLTVAVAAAPWIGSAASSSAYVKSGPSNRAKRIDVGVVGRKYFARCIMPPDDRRDADRQAPQ
jgi:hypothetical protein